MTPIQHRLAAYFRRQTDRAHGEAWARYVEALPDGNEHLAAIERAQASHGAPAEFTPVCDRGLHLRQLADSAPSDHGLAYIATLEGEPEPWDYGDWARQSPPPVRDGVPQWTVDVDVMVRGDDWDWPPEIEHPDVEPVTRYGWGEVWPSYTDHHLEAQLEVWATSEQAALALAQQLTGSQLTGPSVLAHRLRARPTPGEWEDKPRGPEDLEDSVVPVRWQRADIDGAALTIVWRRHGEPAELVLVDEQPDRVTITVHERVGPLWTEDGYPIAIAGPEVFRLGSVRVELKRPLGDRRLLDGATGRAPDDLSIWQYREQEEREQVLKARI